MKIYRELYMQLRKLVYLTKIEIEFLSKNFKVSIEEINKLLFEEDRTAQIDKPLKMQQYDKDKKRKREPMSTRGENDPFNAPRRLLPPFHHYVAAVARLGSLSHGS